MLFYKEKLQERDGAVFCSTVRRGMECEVRLERVQVIRCRIQFYALQGTAPLLRNYNLIERQHHADNSF